MLNKRTARGVFLCAAGILLAKANSLFLPAGPFAQPVSFLGIGLSFFGIAVFASGLRTRREERIKICPECLKKNPAGETRCRKCNKSLQTPA